MQIHHAHRFAGRSLTGPSAHHQSRHHRRRGAALMISLIAVMAIAGIGASLIQMQSAMNKRHAFSIDRRRALYVAEAGIAEAALAVSQGKSGILGTEEVPAAFGGGVYWVETADLPEGRIALTCTSRVGFAEFMLRTTVVPNLNPVASLGFFGADEVEIGWGTVADGYHSGRGTFDSQVDMSLPVTSTGDLSKISSNGNIILEESIDAGAGAGSGSDSGSGGTGSAPDPPPVSPDFSWGGAVAAASSPPPPGDPGDPGDPGAPGGGGDSGGAPPGGGSGGGSLTPPPGAPTRIYGKVEPGTSGIVQSSGFSLVAGSIEPLRYPASLPLVTLPVASEVLPSTVTITTSGATVGTKVETKINGDLVVTTGTTLRLSGPKVLDLQRFVLEAGATLELDDSAGPIEIYSRNGLGFAETSTILSLTAHELSRGTSFTVTESAGNPRRVTIRSSGEFHGTLYAPSDEVVLPASLRWYGSVVARVFKTEPGARITFDRRLAIGGAGVPTLPRIMSWQIVPIGDGSARRMSIDPLLELRLKGIVPLPSSGASPESNLLIQYIDLSGEEQTYVGAFAAFDTSIVDRILGVRWDDPRDGVPRDWIRPAGDDPTNAIASDRSVTQVVRSTIRSVSGLADVELLTNEESVDLVTSLPNDLIAAEGIEVIMIDDRVGGGAARDVTEDAATFDYDKWLDDATVKPADSDATPADVDADPIPGG